MRDSAVFYRSFYEAIKDLPPENQAAVYTAIFEYAFNFKEPELNGINKTIFTLIKPQIQANIKRFKNGSKARQKQSISKTEASNKQAESKREANNNVNNNDNLNEKINKNKNGNVNVNVSLKDSHSLSSFSFLDFWNLYNKKVGLTKCETLWDELTDAEKSLIRQRLPVYIEATESEVMYRKDPFTWRNGKHWLDEYTPAPKKSAMELLAETGSYE